MVKIRKNASTDRYRGSKYRRRAIIEYQNKGYISWSEDNYYEMRWPGIELIFFAVKRKLRKNCVSRSPEGLETVSESCYAVYRF